MALAVGALGRKERSIAELTAWLQERGVAQATVEETIERLIAKGALDDTRFAHRYAEDKREISGWGPDRIRAALGERGVAAEDVAAALEAEGHAEMVERASRLLAERPEPLDGDPARGRALAFLARRGFPPESAYEAVNRAERAQGGAQAKVSG